jgi:hypothetical protein
MMKSGGRDSEGIAAERLCHAGICAGSARKARHTVGQKAIIANRHDDSMSHGN